MSLPLRLRRLRWILIPLAILGVLVLLFLLPWSQHYHLPPQSFAQAGPDRPIVLPGDEAVHYDAASEWWYYTGHLERGDGARYGFELVFFKGYLPPQARVGPLPLRWSASPAYLAQFAITEEATGQFTYAERSNVPFFWRGEAQSGRLGLRMDDWQVSGERGAYHLRASTGRYALSLDLRSERAAPVLHGSSGLVDMGGSGLSYYYSYPHLLGQGTLQVDGQPYQVQALAWTDHQWGSWDWDGFGGWDWAGLQLADGSALMLFFFRGADGGAAGAGGTYVAPGGKETLLGEADIHRRVTAYWTSPATGGVYPTGWEVEVPGQGLRLAITPTVPGQEIVSDWTPIYWEGSVSVQGERAGVPLTGTGYVELTGYVER